MTELLKVRKDWLPVPLYIGAAVFVYLLFLFKRLADEILTIERQRAERAREETDYLTRRFSTVEREMGVKDGGRIKLLNLNNEM